MRKIFFLICTLTLSQVYAQIDIDPDTVLYSERTGGAIDTFDFYNGDLPTVFDGGESVLSESGLSTFRFFQDVTTRKFQRFTAFDPLRFSAIPHLGFAYSFGGQGTQFLRLNYSQAFKENLLFNFNYDRNTGSGYLFNSGFTTDNVRAQLQRDAQRYSFQLKSSFQSNTVSHPGGLADPLDSDSIIRTAGVEFATVSKQQASSATKLGHVFLKNYLNFTNDSLNHFGLTTEHDYSIINREFLETDSIATLYSNVYIDSFTTEDKFNAAAIRNAAGVYFLNRKSQLYIDGLIQHTYWAKHDLGQRVDTNEIGIASNLRIKISDFVLSNRLHFNVIGAFNEWSEKASLTYQRKAITVSGGLLLENKAPDPYQRSLSGNTYKYKLADITNQFNLRAGGGVGYKLKDSLGNIMLKGDFTQLSSVYLFDDTVWRADTLSFSFASFGLKAHLKFGAFHWMPSIVYALDNSGYLPDLQVYSRLYIKTRLFKAKRLEADFGVDASYFTAFNTRAYVPAIDAFNWFETTTNTSGMANLHAFASFGIETFRFYFRFENIGYFWNDKIAQEVTNYPLSGTRLRIGVTWDFFN